MGATDVERQKSNVYAKLLGAVFGPSHQMRHAKMVNEALRLGDPCRRYLLRIGTVAARIPIPPWCAISINYQRETKQQILEREGRLPDTLIACIGGGSNAMGLFHPFLDNRMSSYRC